MQAFAVIVRRFVIVAVLVGIIWGVAANYSYVFSKTVRGEVLEVERVTDPTAIIAGRGTVSSETMFSFAVMIKNADSEIFSASSEDRQWAVVKKGYCVEARFYPYPPWDLEKANTYFNARLLKVYECPAGLPKAARDASAPAASAPAASLPPGASQPGAIAPPGAMQAPAGAPVAPAATP